MENEIENEKVEGGTNNPTVAELLKEFNEFKKNSVPKEDYDKLSSDNKELVKAIMDGNTPEVEQDVIITDKQADEIKKYFASGLDGHKMDLEIAKKVVDLYDYGQSKGIDYAVGTRNSFEPTQDDRYRAKNTIESIREAIDVADGQQDVFDLEMLRRIKK